MLWPQEPLMLDRPLYMNLITNLRAKHHHSLRGQANYERINANRNSLTDSTIVRHTKVITFMWSQNLFEGLIGSLSGVQLKTVSRTSINIHHIRVQTITNTCSRFLPQI
eukprot:scaffold339069_cov15-Prasinocladus_malaysianus.AAC.1